MSPMVRRVRIARKWRTCEAAPCDAPNRLIGVGTAYVRLTLPPGRDVNYGDHFWTVAFHEGCYDRSARHATR